MNGELETESWEVLSADILSGMREWRLQHPKATLREIEQELDQHFYRLRARMVQDLALQSGAADWKDTSATERPVCPDCDCPLTLRGKQPRHLKTSGGHQLTLTRTYGFCPRCKTGLFPPRR